MKVTSDRSEYNKVRKIFLERTGEIKCSRCPYHRCENETNKFYGGYKKLAFGKKSKGKGMWKDKVEYDEFRYPNWKLLTKNKRQWMKKQFKTTTYKHGGGNWGFVIGNIYN